MMARRVVFAAVAVAACGGADAPSRSGVPDTVVRVQVDTAGVRVPSGLAAFCRPGPSSMRADSTASAGQGGAAGEAVPAHTLYEAPHSALEQPVRCVVRRKEDWVALWSALTRTAPALPVPEVDFGSRMVLVAGMAATPSTAYRIAITDVQRSPQGLAATVTQHAGGGCAAGDLVTHPVHAISIPRDPAPVRFIETADFGVPCD